MDSSNKQTIEIDRIIAGLAEPKIQRDLSKYIGRKHNNGFELNFATASSIVKEYAPDKLRDTTAGFSIAVIRSTTMLMAKNADGIIEYTVHLPKDKPFPPMPPDYEDAIGSFIKEKEDYKKLSAIGTFILFILLICCVVLVYFILYFREVI